MIINVYKGVKMSKFIYLLKRKILIIVKSKKLMKFDIEYYRKRGVKIGERARIFSNILTPEPYLLKIKNDVTISTGVKFITHDNSISKIFDDKTDSFGEIEIGNNCFIGVNSIILHGVVLGDNVIVAAGSVVTKSFISGNVVIGGNPARVICGLEQYKKKSQNNAFNTRLLNFNEKKDFILYNKDKLIKRKSES